MKKVILNQKSYLFYDDMVNFKKSFDKLKTDDYEFIIFPPILYLSMFKDSKYKVGTQNFFGYKMGSFTGELNLESLKKIGINYTLIGHFERRKIVFESYEMAKEKLFKSLAGKEGDYVYKKKLTDIITMFDLPINVNQFFQPIQGIEEINFNEFCALFQPEKVDDNVRKTFYTLIDKSSKEPDEKEDIKAIYKANFPIKYYGN